MVQGRYAEAEPLYKRALAIGEKALGLDHPTVGVGLNNLSPARRRNFDRAQAQKSPQGRTPPNIRRRKQIFVGETFDQAICSSRLITRFTCAGVHAPLRAAGIARAFKPSAIASNVVAPPHLKARNL
jgi:hypothetical protein